MFVFHGKSKKVTVVNSVWGRDVQRLIAGDSKVTGRWRSGSAQGEEGVGDCVGSSKGSAHECVYELHVGQLTANDSADNDVLHVLYGAHASIAGCESAI
jgi:hypothetical protein